MLETMTSTPEPDDRRAAPDQTTDHGAADTGDAIVRPEDATSDGPADLAPGAADGRPEDVVAGEADQADEAGADSADVPDAIADASAHDGATRTMESSDGTAEPSGRAELSGDAVESSRDGSIDGDRAIDGADDAADAVDSASEDADVATDTSEDAVARENRGPDPVDAGSARTEAAGVGDARAFDAFDAGTARTEAAGVGDARAFEAAAATGGPPPWASAASGSGSGFVPPWASYRPPPPPPPGHLRLCHPLRPGSARPQPIHRRRLWRVRPSDEYRSGAVARRASGVDRARRLRHPRLPAGLVADPSRGRLRVAGRIVARARPIEHVEMGDGRARDHLCGVDRGHVQLPASAGRSWSPPQWSAPWW